MVSGVKTTLAHSGGGELGHIVRNAGYFLAWHLCMLFVRTAGN